MGNLARRIERRQALKATKGANDPKTILKNLNTLPQALGALNKLGQQLDEAQTAIVQVLDELEYQDYEARRQRAVSLRMEIDRGVEKAPSAWRPTGEGDRVRVPEDQFVSSMVAYEEQLRAEYDAIFAFVRLFTSLEKEP